MDEQHICFDWLTENVNNIKKDTFKCEMNWKSF